MLTAFAALTFFANVAAEPVNLTRHYKEGQATSYKVTANVDENGQAMSLEALIDLKVKKVLKEGAAAEVDLNATKLTMSQGGSDNEAPGMESFTGDANGMLKGTKFKDHDAVFAILGICGFVPGKSVMIGASFPVEWKSDDFKASGTGTVSEVKTVDGKQIAVVKLKIDVTPTDDTPAKLEVTSEISVETGMLIKSEGKVSSDQFNAKLKVETHKAS